MTGWNWHPSCLTSRLCSWLDSITVIVFVAGQPWTEKWPGTFPPNGLLIGTVHCSKRKFSTLYWGTVRKPFINSSIHHSMETCRERLTVSCCWGLRLADTERWRFRTQDSIVAARLETFLHWQAQTARSCSDQFCKAFFVERRKREETLLVPFLSFVVGSSSTDFEGDLVENTFACQIIRLIDAMRCFTGEH